MHTPINKVWNTIRKIKGIGTAEKYKHLKLGNHIITDKTGNGRSSGKINSLAEVLRDGEEGSLYVEDFVICYKSKITNSFNR